MQIRMFRMPTALVAVGVLALLFQGCEKVSPPAEPPRESPASYMKDPKFRKAVADARKELQAIAAERKPLADRMQELVNQYGEDPGKLQNVPEWVSLHRKVTALNRRYEEVRTRQLATVRERLTPTKREISK